jgi:hypothetical protein
MYNNSNSKNLYLLRTGKMARAKLTPVNLATWEVEIWGIMVPGQPTKKSLQDPISTAKKKKAGHCGTYLSSQ